MEEIMLSLKAERARWRKRKRKSGRKERRYVIRVKKRILTETKDEKK
jgi:hypothetical protein